MEIWSQNDVVSTSMRRHHIDVNTTSSLRHVPLRKVPANPSPLNNSLKLQSYYTKFRLCKCKSGMMQNELVRRRRNAVETDKDVMRSYGLG